MQVTRFLKIFIITFLLGVVCCNAAAAPGKFDVRVSISSKGEPLPGVVAGFPDCGYKLAPPEAGNWIVPFYHSALAEERGGVVLGGAGVV